MPYYEYIIYGIAPEVPQGHEFLSEIEDLDNHPELWKEACPYSIPDTPSVRVEKKETHVS